MNLTNEEFSIYMKKYKQFVDEITIKYHYDSNISHLLYVIVPAFVFKYGFREENYILDIFRNVEIVIKDKHDLVNQASFGRSLRLENGGYKTNKYIFLYNYENISLIQLLDNLVHEFNHAMNSIKNEISWDDSYVYLRTGLSKVLYDRNTLKSVEVSGNIVLEEIINTKQTENIVNLISTFSKYTIENSEVETIVYSIANMISDGYKSRSYYLESNVCKKLLENKTFIHTLENLRYKGEVLELDEWFDNITGEVGSFKKLNELLNRTISLEHEIVKRKMFRRYYVNKLSNYVNEILRIVNKFNTNCNYK